MNNQLFIYLLWTTLMTKYKMYMHDAFFDMPEIVFASEFG